MGDSGVAGSMSGGAGEKAGGGAPGADVRDLTLWAAGCAERVLDIFTASYPTDSRPGNAIAVARAWANGDSTVDSCRAAAMDAHVAARTAQEAGALAAAASARASAQVVSIAHLPSHAAQAAQYAAAAAVMGRAHSRDSAAELTASERRWQWDHLAEELRPLGFPTGL